MRDGASLYTVIYTPKAITGVIPNDHATYVYMPHLYGDQFKKSIGPSETMMKEGYIVVYQDVRGRWMSDGLYDNMRAFIPNKKSQRRMLMIASDL
jgi:predicted acyl esterase